MPETPVYLIVGLGNPGAAYDGTRHNIGFRVADALARSFSISLTEEKFDAQIGHGRIENIRAVLVKPMLFMNRSGPPVHALSKELGISVRNIMVIHDDMDLDLGRIKIKEKGGHGGHRGIRSLTDAFDGGDFVRLRIGIGRPAEGADVVDHVLGQFTADESALADQLVTRARDAVVTVLCKGTKEGMNVFNRKTF